MAAKRQQLIMLAGAGVLAWLLVRRSSASTQNAPAVAPFQTGGSASWGTGGRESVFPSNNVAELKNSGPAIDPNLATTGGNMLNPSHHVNDFSTWGTWGAGGGGAPKPARVDADGIRTFSDGTSEPIANTPERRQQLLAIWADQAAGKPGTLGGYLFPGQ